MALELWPDLTYLNLMSTQAVLWQQERGLTHTRLLSGCSDNRIGDDGAELLAKNLQYCTQLESIVLNGELRGGC